MIKRYVTVFLLIFAVLASMIPHMAYAAENKEDKMSLDVSGNMLTVKLELPNASGEKLSSLQFRLSLDNGTFGNFSFNPEVTGRAKVYEAYYSKDKKTLNVYIAGTQPLYTSDTLSIGSVTVQASGKEKTAAVQAGNVKVVRGTDLEDKDLSASAQVTFGQGGSYPGGSYPGGYYPGQGAGGTQSPPEPEGPSEEEKPGEEIQEEAEIAKPLLKKAQNAASGVTVKWSKSKNASGYYVYRKVPGGRWKRIAALKGKDTVSYTDKAVKAKNGKTYIYTVKAYNGEKVSIYDKNGLKIYRLTAPAITKLKALQAKSASVKWKANKKASGYQVQYAVSANFKKQKLTKTVKPAAKVSKKITKLQRNKTYYVRIRSYKKVGKTAYYSAWSKVKKVKAR